MKILVTGATGLVGRHLLPQLLAEGHEVYALARTPAKLKELPRSQVYTWSDSERTTPEMFEGIDAIVHLAGEGIADKRWTAERKKRLQDSRILGTEHLLAGLYEVPSAHRPKTLISASGMGIYGDTGETAADESTAPGTGFLADLCVDWEKAALRAQELGLRTVLMRTGIVLAPDGGALKKMGPAVLGNGQQWMSWIHIDDLIRFIMQALKIKGMQGAYDLTSPNPVRNKEFTKVLAKARGWPLTVPAPAFALRLALGEMADELLASQRVLPGRLLKSEFTFDCPDLASALRRIHPK